MFTCTAQGPAGLCFWNKIIYLSIYLSIYQLLKFHVAILKVNRFEIAA